MTRAERDSRVAALAERLLQAERERRAIPRLTSEDPDLDPDLAYEVQARFFAARSAEGERSIGYKLGLTSRAKQEAMGVAEPLWGLLSTSMIWEEDRPLEVGCLIHPRVEAEIAFLLEDDLEGPGVTVPAVLAATEGVCAALEILDSRFENFDFGLADVIADNASAAKLVLGGRLLPPDRLDVCREGMVMRADGEVVHTAAGAAVMGHPAAAVAFAANASGGIPAGSIVLSGGLTAPVPLRAGSVIAAEFTSLGTVTLRCA